ncbi:MAG: response regulator, partial [Candidatus Riflebacteria bacterium]|nr:response regulator [Candidatus Riflebacteria bacterium]
ASAVERELRETETRRQRQIAEAALVAEKERLCVTLRSIGEGVITTDTHGAITLLNPVAEELTGWSMAEVENHAIAKVFQLLNQDTREPFPNPCAQVLESKKRQESHRPNLLINRHGVERKIAHSASPIMDSHNCVIGVVLVFRDVTNEEKINEVMRNSEKLHSLGVLAGGIAHDFNNLLSGIFGNLELAQDFYRTGEHTMGMEVLGDALGVFGRAKDLTHQLLTFSKGGKPVLKVMSIIPLFRQSPRLVLSGSNVIFEEHLPENLWPCNLDENQMSQVIDNILLNARQAMPEGGTINVTAENIPAGSPDIPLAISGDVVRVSICDSGTGIDPKLLSCIFDPFFTTKQGSGNGLGLSIVYSIMKQHGGLVRVVSQLGKGTTFILYLPRAKASDDTETLAQSIQKPQGHGRVLIMDDEKAICKIFQRVLENCGYSVSLANNGDEAISLFRTALESSDPFNMVILDLTIPGGKGGKETVDELRQITPDILAIATSGYSSDPVLANPLQYGFSAGLGKPFTMTDIYQVIHALKAAEIVKSCIQ